MSHELDPKVGRWYRRLDDEQLFKVASIDEDDGLIEIKTVDGEVEELDSAEWIELDREYAEAPEDYVDPDEDSDEDVLALTPSLDLLPLVEDELILALPLVPRHEACPQPLAMSAGEDELAADEDGEHAFAGLASLLRDGGGKPS